MAVHEMNPDAAPRARTLPEVVTIDPQNPIPPHSPREVETCEQGGGKPFQDMVGPDAAHADRTNVIVFLALRRLGYEPTWQEARDVLVDYQSPDPPIAASSATSPGSATTGG